MIIDEIDDFWPDFNQIEMPQQIQGIPAQGRGANCPSPRLSDPLVHPTAQSATMRQLFQARRLYFNMTGIRFISVILLGVVMLFNLTLSTRLAHSVEKNAIS